MSLIKIIQKRISKKYQAESKIHKLFIALWKGSLEPELQPGGFNEKGERKPDILVSLKIRQDYLEKLKEDKLIRDVDLFAKDLNLIIKRTMFREKVRDHATGQATGCALCKERIMRNAFLNVFLKHVNKERLK